MAEKKINITGDSQQYQQAIKDAQNAQKQASESYVNETNKRIRKLSEEQKILDDQKKNSQDLQNTQQNLIGKLDNDTTKRIDSLQKEKQLVSDITRENQKLSDSLRKNMSIEDKDRSKTASDRIKESNYNARKKVQETETSEQQKEIQKQTKEEIQNKEKLQQIEQKKQRQRRREQRSGGGVGQVAETGLNTTIARMGQAIQTGKPAEALMGAMGGMTGSLLSMIPGVGGLLGGITNTITSVATSAMGAASERSMQNLLTKNLTGESLEGISGLMTATDAAPYIRSISKERGRAGQGEIQEQLLLERRTGQDFGTFSPLNRFEQMYETEDMSAARLMQKFLENAANSKLWNIDKGDFSALGDKLQIQAQLMQREAELSENITGDRAMAIQMAFGAIGGGFADNRSQERIRNIDEAIRNPTNKYMQNVVRSAIMAENPDVSLSELKDIQAGGLLSPRVFGRVLQNISTLPAEQQHLFLQTMIPSFVGNREARELLLENKDLFMGDFTPEEITEKITARVGGGEKERKKIEDIVSKTTSTPADDYRRKMVTLLERIGFYLNDKIYPILESVLRVVTVIGEMSGEDFIHKLIGKSSLAGFGFESVRDWVGDRDFGDAMYEAVFGERAPSFKGTPTKEETEKMAGSITGGKVNMVLDPETGSYIPEHLVNVLIPEAMGIKDPVGRKKELSQTLKKGFEGYSEYESIKLEKELTTIKDVYKENTELTKLISKLLIKIDGYMEKQKFDETKGKTDMGTPNIYR